MGVHSCSPICGESGGKWLCGTLCSKGLCPVSFHTMQELGEKDFPFLEKEQEFRGLPCFCLGWNEKLSRYLLFLRPGKSLLAGALAADAGDTCTNHLSMWFSHWLELGFPTSKTNALNTECLLQWLNFVLTFFHACSTWPHCRWLVWMTAAKQTLLNFVIGALHAFSALHQIHLLSWTLSCHHQHVCGY